MSDVPDWYLLERARERIAMLEQTLRGLRQTHFTCARGHELTNEDAKDWLSAKVRAALADELAEALREVLSRGSCGCDHCEGQRNVARETLARYDAGKQP